MPDAFSVRRLFQRFFPKKEVLALPERLSESAYLTEEQKKELALQALSRGEASLLRGSLSALSSFETAARLDPRNADIWLRQGLAFSDYGSRKGREKALFLAIKYFKIALQLDPENCRAWVACGDVLLQLGRKNEEQHFYLRAKENYERAIALGAEQTAQFYWNYALVWTSIGAHSGEAIDFHCAGQAFERSATLQPNQSATFWNDYADAYAELGLLVSDQRCYARAAELLENAVRSAPECTESWLALGDVYSQMYLNSMDESFVEKASASYATVVKLAPDHVDGWLAAAQLLAETGRLNKRPKALLNSIERCIAAATIDPENSAVAAQHIESLSTLGSLTGRLELLLEADQKARRAAEQFPDDPDVWYAFGLCLMAFARYFEDAEYGRRAIEHLQYSLSFDRTNAEVWHALGLAHHSVANLTDEEVMVERAARFLAKAMDLKPLCPALTFDTALAFLDYSETFDDLSALEYSLALFESLLQQQSESLLHHPEWLFGYASALDWLGDFTGEEKDFVRALEFFSKVLLIDPDFPHLHFRIALSHVQLGHLTGEIDHYKKAMHAFKLASRQDEENESLWLEWGLCLLQLAVLNIEKERAEQCFFEAEQKISRAGHLGHPKAYYTLACLYSLSGDTDRAMAFIRYALATRTLPPLELIVEDEWLVTLRETSLFAQFLAELEAKLQAREQ